MERLNVDLTKENYTFPFYFKDEEEYRDYLLTYKREFHLSKYTIEKTEKFTVAQYTGDWEELKTREFKDVDPYYKDVNYLINNYSFRGINTPFDITENTTVFAGCSLSFGMGVYEEEIWGNKAYGKDTVNMSIPGDSTERILRRLSGMLDFKRPKHIAILLPTPERVDMIMDSPNTGDPIEISFAPGIIRKGTDSWDYDLYMEYLKGSNRYMEFLWYQTALEAFILKCSNLGIELTLGSWCPFVTYGVLPALKTNSFKVTEFLKTSDYPKARDPLHFGYQYHDAIAKTFIQAT